MEIKIKSLEELIGFMRLKGFSYIPPDKKANSDFSYFHTFHKHFKGYIHSPEGSSIDISFSCNFVEPLRIEIELASPIHVQNWGKNHITTKAINKLASVLDWELHYKGSNIIFTKCFYISAENLIFDSKTLNCWSPEHPTQIAYIDYNSIIRDMIGFFMTFPVYKYHVLIDGAPIHSINEVDDIINKGKSLAYIDIDDCILKVLTEY